MIYISLEFGIRAPPQYQYKDGLSRYGDFHYKNKTAVRQPYLYNGNFYTAKKVSFTLRRPPMCWIHYFVKLDRVLTRHTAISVFLISVMLSMCWYHWYTRQMLHTFGIMKHHCVYGQESEISFISGDAVMLQKQLSLHDLTQLEHRRKHFDQT